MNIQTKRLRLKAIDQASLTSLAELLTDETVKQTYMVPDFASFEEAVQMARRIALLSRDPQRHVAGIYCDGVLIGMLNETDREGSTVEVGYALHPRFYNRGYATEALTAAIDFFFDHGFTTVLAGAFEENSASLRVMEKSGMLPIDREDRIDYRGRQHRCVYRARKKCKRVKITAIRKASYPDLMAKYENPILHTCDVEEGMVWVSENGERPQTLCESAWTSMESFVRELARGGGNFYDGWMRNPYSAMISCNDGFRPVSFYLEALEE